MSLLILLVKYSKDQTQRFEMTIPWFSSVSIPSTGILYKQIFMFLANFLSRFDKLFIQFNSSTFREIFG